jgi:F-type H+-transporting ATPase subunit alpha
LGIIKSCEKGVIEIKGLTKACIGEFIILKDSKLKALVLTLKTKSLVAVVLGPELSLKPGDLVKRSSTIFKIPTGYRMLGRVIDAFGNPIDGLGKIETTHMDSINFKGPGIVERASVDKPVLTGIVAVDTMIPIGRGQRELIIGDKQTGKTSIVLDTIVNQKNQFLSGDKSTFLYCIYVAIGQKISSIAKMVASLKQKKAFSYSILIASTAAESAALQFLTPYSGCTLGE